MKRVDLYIMIFFVIITNNSIYAQEFENSIIIEDISEINETEDADYTVLFDQLEYYKKNPLNINTATEEDLHSLGFLNQFQVCAILDYRKKFSTFLSLNELLTIKEFDDNIVQLLKSYVVAKPIIEKEEIIINDLYKDAEQLYFIRFQRNLEPKLGYRQTNEIMKIENKAYLGSAWKYYNRYHYNFKNRILFGITAEKDAGEEFFRGSQNWGFDFYSGHLCLKDIKKIKMIVIGDYVASFGQALTFSNGFSIFKTFDIFSINTGNNGLKPYTASDENNYLRGAGISFGFRNLTVTTFTSYKNIDANIDTIKPEQRIIVSSLINTGYHNTNNTIIQRKNLNQIINGGYIFYKGAFYKTGITAYNCVYNIPIEKKQNGSYTYKKFEFSGTSNSVIGADYSISLQPFIIFGEAAYSINGAIAYINGLMGEIHPAVSMSLLHRHYPIKYQNLYCSPFRYNMNVSNEDGLYSGLALRLSNVFNCSASYDFYRFPWIKYQCDAPSFGRQYMLQTEYIYNKNLTILLRYRVTEKNINSEELNEVMRYSVLSSRKNVRLHIKINTSSNLSLNNRLELSFYGISQNQNKEGFLMFQDIIYKNEKLLVTSYFRFTIFDIDSWDARIYAYENDLLYVYSMPAYYYRGIRYYWMIKYELTKQIKCWIKYSITSYSNRKIIGSGLEQINGNRNSEIKFQLLFNI